MALVVFMRAVNVGGHRKFSPAALARDLAQVGAVNIGAAGTFVIRGAIGEKALRREILKRLPFEPELMILPARDITGLLRREPFGRRPSKPDIGWFVGIMGTSPRPLPRLPIERPEGTKWEVRIVEIAGPFALSLRRRIPGGRLYPNEVIEKTLGVSATTRGWNTISAIGEILESS